jgi:hypothetical protein
LSSYLPDFFLLQEIEILATLTLGLLEKKRKNKHTRNLEKSKRKGKNGSLRRRSFQRKGVRQPTPVSIAAAERL